MTDCCQAHDGPHLHGCTVGRMPFGREHRGQCLTNKKASAELHLDARQQEPQHQSEATGEPTMNPTTIVPPATDNTQCPDWCDRAHDYDLGYTLHRGDPWISVLALDSDGHIEVNIEQLDDDEPLIELMTPDGGQYYLTPAMAGVLIAALSVAVVDIA